MRAIATTFFGLIAACWLVPPAAAQSKADTVFTIANYPVEAKAQDAVAAKERALSEGQQAAFRSLLKRLVPVTAYTRLKPLRSVKAADLVEGVSVRSERNSTTEYIASLDFAFSPQGIRDLLRRQGVPFVDVQAAPTVVVPVVRGPQGPESALSRSAKTWTDSWLGLDLDHALTPVKLGEPKTAVNEEVLKQLIEGKPGGLQRLASEYRSDFAVAAIAEPDLTARRVTITLSGADPAGPILLKRSYRLPGGDLVYAMELAAVVALGTIEGRWKAMSASGRGIAAAFSGGADTFEIVVEFRNRGQWEEIRQQLQETPGVRDLDVTSLTPRNAVVSMVYPGGVQQLSGAVEGGGLSLRNAGGTWLLRSGL